MTAISQGNGYELEAKKILESKGWTVFRQHRKPIFMNGKMIMVGCDVFASDLIAKKKGEKTLWVQVTTRPQKAAKERTLMEQPWNFDCDSVQLWLRESGKREFEVFSAPDFYSIGTVKSLKTVREKIIA